MQKVLITACVAALVLFGTPALACVPMPGPDWSRVPQPEGGGIAIGRVLAVKPDGSSERYDFVRLEIETLETLQGQVPDRFEIREIAVHRPEPDAITLWCGRISSEKPGDVVIATAYGDAGYRLLIGSRLPETVQAKMQAYAGQAGITAD